MIFVLSGFIAVLALVWGLNVAAIDGGQTSLPWLIREQGLYLSGLLSIGLMSLAMVLATRPVMLERPLGGMDRIFRLHKWSGVLAAVFAAAHWLIEMADDLIKAVYGRGGRPAKIEFGGVLETLRDAGEALGEFAIYLVLGMVVLSLWKRFPYTFWRHLHRAMPVLYLLLAFHAAVLAPLDYWSQPVGVVLALLLAAGVVAAGISLTGGIGRNRRVAGVVTAVSSPAPDVTEIVCRLEGAWRGHRGGQFAFVAFTGLGRFEGAHPFTIASADHGDRTLTFQIKALGDHTRQLASRVRVGQPVMVEGPYGRFVLERHDRKAHQVWVAGGIGVTPFLAWLDEMRTNHQGGTAIDLHYSTRDARRDPFVGRLQTLCAELPALTLHVHDSAAGTDLTADMLSPPDANKAPVEIWFCGPRRFGDQLKAGLTRLWRRRIRFHREAFEMR
jgi:predicted ferric reductase